jgi:hypothetical protein
MIMYAYQNFKMHLVQSIFLFGASKVRGLMARFSLHFREKSWNLTFLCQMVRLQLAKSSKKDLQWLIEHASSFEPTAKSLDMVILYHTSIPSISIEA